MTEPKPQPHTLPNLTAREAVADALYRCVLGLDSNDRPLFESAMVQDASARFIVGPTTLSGWPAISAAMERAFQLVTTHQVSNVRVAVEERAEVASLTAHTLSWHVRPGEEFGVEDTSYTARCLYYVDLSTLR